VRSRLSSDTLLLGTVLVLTLGIAIFAVRSGRGREQDDRSVQRTTYSAAQGGYQALFETLAALDYPVRRWRLSFQALADRGTMVVASPETPITGQEWRGLARWVGRGNLLIFLADFAGGAAVPARLAEWLETPEAASWPVQPAPVASTAPGLRTRAAFHWRQSEWAPVARDRGDESNEEDAASQLTDPLITPSPLVPLYRDQQGITVAYTRWGSGAVILCSSPWSLSTAGVGKGHNFAWLLATIAAYGPGPGVGGQGSGVSKTKGDVVTLTPGPRPLTPILFDEYHHGYGAERGVLSLLAPIARLGLAQLAVAWLLLLYTVSRRFGGRVPDEGRVRRSRSEYLGSMTSLLRRARAVDLAVSQVRRQFLNDAHRALGLPRDAEPSALLASAATRGVDPERLRSLLDRAERLTATRDRGQQDEALAVARELARVRRQLSGEGSGVEAEISAPPPDRSLLTPSPSHD
jgi:uncharacterized protein DUF4350